MFTNLAVGRASADMPRQNPLDIVNRQIWQLRRLCDAIEVIVPRYPDRVRAVLLETHNEVLDGLQDLERSSGGEEGELVEELRQLTLAFRRLEARVDAAVTALERLQQESAPWPPSPDRARSGELEDRIDRGPAFGRVNRSYDGWRRRP